MQRIAGLQWPPHRVLHMGCVLGCAEHLRLSISPAWQAARQAPGDARPRCARELAIPEYDIIHRYDVAVGLMGLGLVPALFGYRLLRAILVVMGFAANQMRGGSRRGTGSRGSSR